MHFRVIVSKKYNCSLFVHVGSQSIMLTNATFIFYILVMLN